MRGLILENIEKDGEDKWFKRRKSLVASRCKTVSVNTQRKGTKLAKWISATTLFVPFGVALISAVDFEKFVMPWVQGGKLYVLFWVGAILSLAPLWAAFLWRLIGDKDESGKLNWNFLQSDSTENYTQDVSEQGERTSIEFAEHFEAILEKILAGQAPRYRRAVIVVDNLDRVDPQDALSIWATLQTFLQTRNGGKSSQWFSKLWVIVPYDREGLAKIWDNSVSKEKVTEKGGEDNDLNGALMSQSFFDKCFQICLDVPESPYENWMDHLHDLANEGLGKWDEDSRDKIVDTYKRYQRKQNSMPTPREMKNFVNQTGVLGMQWAGIVSDESLALYSLLRRNKSVDELREDLRASKIPDRQCLSGDYEKIRENIADILFGRPGKGMQLLLKPVIQELLEKGDGSSLKKLIQEQGKGFWAVWKICEDDLIGVNGKLKGKVGNATVAIADSFGDMLDGEFASSLALLRNHWLGHAINISDVVQVRGFEFMVGASTNYKDVIDKLYECFRESLDESLKEWVEEIEVEDGKDITPEWMPNVIVCISSLNKVTPSLSGYRYDSLGRVGWTRWIRQVVSIEGYDASDDNGFSLIRPKETLLEEYREHQELGDSFDSDDLWAIERALVISPDLRGWDLMPEWLGAFLQIQPDTESAQGGLYMLGLIYAKFKGSRESVESIVKHYDTIYNLVVSEGESVLKYASALVGITLKGVDIDSSVSVTPASRPGVTSIQAYWSDEGSKEKAIEVLDILKDWSAWEFFWPMLKNSENKLLRKIVLEANKKYSNLFAYPECLYALGYATDDIVKDDLEDVMVSAFLSAEGLTGDVVTTLSNDPNTYGYCLNRLVVSENDQAVRIANEILTNVSETQWGKSFADDDTLVFAALETEGLRLDHRFGDALQGYLIGRITNGGSYPEWYCDRLKEILKLVGRSSPNIMEEFMKVYLRADEDSLSEQEFKIVKLVTTESLKNQDTHLVCRRVKHWLQTQFWLRIMWLSQLNIKFNATKADKADLRTRLTQVLVEKEKDQEIASAIRAVGKQFDMTLRIPRSS